MALLARIGDLSGAERTEDAIEGIADAIVPAAADTCWVDVREPDGELRRLFEHGVQAPPPQDVSTDADTTLIELDHFGVLGLRTLRGDYNADDRAFLRVLAGRVALVLANARLLTDLRSTRTRLDGILGSLAEAVTVNDDTGQTIYANQAAARLLGEETPDDVVRAKPGELAERFAMTDEDGAPVALADLPGRRLLKGEPAPELLTRSVNLETGRGYWLLTKARLLQDQGRSYAVNIIEDVTTAKEAERRQRFLAEAGQILSASLESSSTLQRVADLAVSFLADWCSIDLPTADGGIEQVAVAHKDPAKLRQAIEVRRRHPPEAGGAVADVLNGGPAILHPESPPDRRDALLELGARSAMTVPIRLGEDTLGVITLAGHRRFTAADFAFAQDVALRVATAMQNARLYAAQVQISHTLQASLLPERLPTIPGWTAAASYQAGEQGADVGGDFYDILTTARGHLVFLGDVTGRGIRAAALTSLVRHSVRTAARFDPRPEQILALVNDVLCEQSELSPVTLVVALIARDTLTVAAAGHPAPLLKRGHDVKELGTAGLLLGVMSEQTYVPHTTELRTDDALVLYTDGVTDTPGTDDRFGPERLARLLERAPDEPAEAIAAIEEALKAFQTGSTIDDRALLVLRYATTI
jgi:PAS domain S-box-containing protein